MLNFLGNNLMPPRVHQVTCSEKSMQIICSSLATMHCGAVRFQLGLRGNKIMLLSLPLQVHVDGPLQSLLHTFMRLILHLVGHCADGAAVICI
jgi:hypothetical protein